MVESTAASGFNSLIEAYQNKNIIGGKKFHLNKTSIKPRKGCPLFAVYENSNASSSDLKESSLNDLRDMPFVSILDRVTASKEENSINPSQLQLTLKTTRTRTRK